MSANDQPPTREVFLRSAASIDEVRNNWKLVQRAHPNGYNSWIDAFEAFGRAVRPLYERQGRDLHRVSTQKPPEINAVNTFVDAALANDAGCDQCMAILIETTASTGGFGPFQKKGDRSILHAWYALVSATTPLEPTLGEASTMYAVPNDGARAGLVVSSSASAIETSSQAPVRAAVPPSSRGPTVHVIQDNTAQIRQALDQMTQLESYIGKLAQSVAGMQAQLAELNRFWSSLPQLQSGEYVTRSEFDQVSAEARATRAQIDQIIGERNNQDQTQQACETDIISAITHLADKHATAFSEASQDPSTVVARNAIDQFARLLDQYFAVELIMPSPGERVDRDRMTIAATMSDKQPKADREYVVLHTVVPGFRRRGGDVLHRPVVMVGVAK